MECPIVIFYTALKGGRVFFFLVGGGGSGVGINNFWWLSKWHGYRRSVNQSTSLKLKQVHLNNLELGTKFVSLV